MIQISPAAKISEEEFLQHLTQLRRTTTTPRFSLQLTTDQAVSLLSASYRLCVQDRHRTYLPDHDTQSHISQLARIIAQPPPQNAPFGILLCGQCGNGKTTLIHALREAIAFRFHDTTGITTNLEIIDAKSLVRIAKTDPDRYRRLCIRDLLAIDDLGIEPSEVLDYGNTINPAIDLLSERYNLQLFTIVSTNLTPSQLREHYGDRMADRFNEFFNRIIFSNPSYRSPTSVPNPHPRL